jgi:hypothetical protein
MVEHLASTFKAFGSVPSTTKEKKKKDTGKM